MLIRIKVFCRKSGETDWTSDIIYEPVEESVSGVSQRLQHLGRYTGCTELDIVAEEIIKNGSAILSGPNVAEEFKVTVFSKAGDAVYESQH